MRTALLIMLLLAGALHAREVRVTGDGAGQATLARLQSQIEPGFDQIHKKTGIADDEPVHLHVIAGSEAFTRTARADGVSMNAESVLGYAMPARRRVVLNLSGISERGLEPVGVLRHELAHLVMGSQLRVQRPLWFEEGVAQYVEGVALNELREGASPSLGAFSDLADLDAALRDDNRAGAAYAESREVIRLIVARHGESSFFALMKALERGEGPFDQAFERATGEGIESFQVAWLEDQEARAGSRLARFVGGMFWWFVLGMGALVVPLVWLLRRRRGQSQVEQWEEQEKYFPSDPEWSYTDDD
ncbi:MAG: hypothetical protein KF696_05325 [Planctomycetes bacterium]|nr:hypothetical protein [Planctomycetota bacterium]MCW8136307.1 hypothetical protein [Planctomycetota bacterium]